jgi:hypothetical protein
MVESNWWDVSPWWAQSLIVMGGIVIYIIIGIMTYVHSIKRCKKISVKKKKE